MPNIFFFKCWISFRFKIIRIDTNWLYHSLNSYQLHWSDRKSGNFPISICTIISWIKWLIACYFYCWRITIASDCGTVPFYAECCFFILIPPPTQWWGLLMNANNGSNNGRNLRLSKHGGQFFSWATPGGCKPSPWDDINTLAPWWILAKLYNQTLLLRWIL